jgi:hypothetical protein
VLSAPQIDPIVAGDRPLLLGRSLRVGLTLLGCVAGALWCVRIPAALRAQKVPGLLLPFTALHVPLLLSAPEFYDRYLLVLLPGGLALARPPVPAPRAGWAAALACVAALAVVSVGWMHDWLAWNSARWDLGRRAVAHRIPPLAIEGGFEWDGWYGPGRRPGSPSKRPVGLVLFYTHRMLGQYVTGHYALSFSPLPGTVTLDSAPYSTWLPPGEHRFYLVGLPPADAPRRP